MTAYDRKFRYAFRLYVLYEDEGVLGKGGAQILDAIQRLGSLRAAAKELKMSYRFVWKYVHKMEDRLGRQVIVTRRGTTLHAKNKGGGGTTITPVARRLLVEYLTVEERLRKQLPDNNRTM